MLSFLFPFPSLFYIFFPILRWDEKKFDDNDNRNGMKFVTIYHHLIRSVTIQYCTQRHGHTHIHTAVYTNWNLFVTPTTKSKINDTSFWGMMNHLFLPDSIQNCMIVSSASLLFHSHSKIHASCIILERVQYPFVLLRIPSSSLFLLKPSY